MGKASPAASDDRKRAPAPGTSELPLSFTESCLQNRHAAERRLFEERVLPPLRCPRWKWTASATRHLEEVVRGQLQEEALRRRFPPSGSASLVSAPQERQKSFLAACAELRSATLEGLMEELGASLDWMSVAEKALPNPAPVSGGRRGAGNCMGAASCKIHFYHAIDHRVAREAFGEAEELALCNLVRQQGPFDWDGVAERLGTRRTAWQCFARFWRRARPRAAWEWTEREDLRLRAICKELCRGGRAAAVDWALVKARFGDGPTEEDCRLQWSKWRGKERGAAASSAALQRYFDGVRSAASSSSAPAPAAPEVPAEPAEAPVAHVPSPVVEPEASEGEAVDEPEPLAEPPPSPPKVVEAVQSLLSVALREKKRKREEGGRRAAILKARRLLKELEAAGSGDETSSAGEVEGNGGRRCGSCGTLPRDAFDAFCYGCGAELGGAQAGEVLSPLSP